jgi:probable rRNA maturation factor
MSMKSDPLITWRRPPASLRKAPVERFARDLRAVVTRSREFHCLVTGDAELKSLNLRFRGKDATTDVLSFPSGDRDPLGDIAISLGRARAQARERGHSIETEVCILMLHGVLHLLGMDHEADNGRMAKSEVRWQRKLGLPTGLIERTLAIKSRREHAGKQ